MRKSIEQKWKQYNSWIKFIGLLISWMLVIYLLIVHMDRDVWVLLIFIIVFVGTLIYSYKQIKTFIAYQALAMNKSEILKTSGFFYNPSMDQCFVCQSPIGKKDHYHLSCDCLIHKECYEKSKATSGKIHRCPICQELVSEINEYVYVYLEA